MTGVILAGGKARRLSGMNKAFIRVGGAPIIDVQVKLFKKLFDEIIIVTNDCIPYLKYDTVIVSDTARGKGPLGGIYTALLHSTNDRCFVAACDMPFLSERLIKYMIKSIGTAWIYTIVREQPGKSEAAGYEPLHSIYSKKCLKTIKGMIINDELKISPLFRELRAKTMNIDEVKQYDPDMLSLRNINTSSDIKDIDEPVA